MTRTALHEPTDGCSDGSGLWRTARVKHKRQRGPGRLGDADLDDDLLSEGVTTVVSDGRGGFDPKEKRKTIGKKKKKRPAACVADWVNGEEGDVQLLGYGKEKGMEDAREEEGRKIFFFLFFHLNNKNKTKI